MSNELVPADDRRRTDQIALWLIEGARTQDILDAIAKHWPSEPAEQLIEAAVQQFANAATSDLAPIVGWAMESYRDLYRRMVHIGDYANALKAIEKLVNLAAKHCVPIEPEESEEDDAGEPEEEAGPGPAEGPDQPAT